VTTIDVEFFRDLAQKLRTQDNACTADPIYTAQEEVTVYGYEEDWGGDLEWFRDDDDHAAATPAQARRLEALYQSNGEARSGWIRTFSRKHWEIRETFLTLDAANEYIATRQRKHRGKLRLYVESAYRNPELRKLREQLLLIADHLCAAPSIARSA
jgi:hypothetical protein